MSHSTSQHTKNRLSKIDRLPDDIKSQLNMLLRDGRMTQEEIRNQINDLIAEQGVLAEERGDEEYIKRNALSRYSKSFHKGMENYKRAQEMTKQWVQQFGEMPQTDIARTLIEVGKSQIFDFQMAALEEGQTIDPKTLGQMALAIKRLQEAQTGSIKLESEIRQQAFEEAAEKTEAVAKKAGLTSDTVKMLKSEILGI